MATKPVNIKNLKKGSYVMVDDEPCKVMGITLSKPGKHGSTKARIEVMGIVDGRKKFIVKPSYADVEAPIIEKKSGQVISLSGDIVQLMDLEDYSTFETNIPEEFKEKLESGKEVVYWKIGKKIIIKDIK